MPDEIMLSAREAAAELGVRVETLYSYVSRGLIRSEPGPGRARLYSASDVRAFRLRDPALRQQAEGGGTEKSEPTIIHSSLTDIDPEFGPLYRGRRATELAGESSLESVATLLWGCDGINPFDDEAPSRPLASAPQALRAVERAMVMLSAWPVVDRSAYAHHPSLLWRHGAALCRLVASELVNMPPSSLPIADVMANAWGIKEESDRQLISAALVLSADHELNSSAYAVRVAASTGAPLHGALVSGLGTFLGPKHGGASVQVEHWLDGLPSDLDVAAMMEERLMRADKLPGFGHLLYDQIDPRAVCLLNAIEEAYPDHPRMRLTQELIEEAKRLFGLAPNIDFSLAVLKDILGLPETSGMALFCAGRMVGWIGHAIEQYGSGQHIRPRAVYVGPKAI
ncbi:citrate synthase family protein [Cohaesibacter gelatinilyticus]|uniref:citrate synthase (unknown stereospecificity) n=1 Tax=Cohaesibacter gelatinilyticus TaxID=372072 RepID=A0A285PCM1_9HYPH|nr:citrate synthase family protein [Cohaesibacter gelatinilyticus]SNZ18993.1 citrate synthase [Cohaesibacter gelatinilyticus]